MKNKISKLLIAIPLVLVLTGCSFINDIINGGNSNTYSYKQVDKEIKDLEIDKNKQTDFNVGSDFVKPRVIATYEDGTTEDVTEKCEFTGYNMNVTGKQTVTVKYSNWTISYDITISEGSIGKTAKKIDLPDGYKGNYFTGDTFVKPKVIATFTDDTEEDVTEYCTFEVPDMNLAGKHEVKIKFQRYSFTFSITITERYAKEQNNCYFSDYEKTLVIDEPHRFYYFAKKDGEEDKKYDNHFTVLVGTHYSVEDDSIVSINDEGEIVALKAGETYVHCINERYGEVKFDFRCLVKVEEKHATKLEVLNYRDKYYSGKQFNFMCKAKVIYQTGYEEEVNPFVDSSKVNMAVPGNYNVTISYSINGTTASVTKGVTVLDSSLYKLDKTPLDYRMVDYYKNSFGTYAMPTRGDVKMLVIPVKFKETDQYIANYANVKEDINATFFGSNDRVGWRSVETFYEEESKGLINIIGKTSDWYDSGLSYKDCYDSSVIAQLKADATKWFFDNNPSEDRKSYDADHDGRIDGLCLVYGSLDYRTGDLEGEGASNLWAMVRTIGNERPDVDKPVSCKFLWASYDNIYPTKAKALERTEKSDYSEDDKYNSGPAYLTLDTRTMIHETGHMLGIFDYYAATDGGAPFPAGHTNMQTLNFFGHDPYSLLQYDWADPYIPEFSQTITITDFQDNHDVIMLKPNNGLVNSTFDEYILIDLFAPTGLNKFNSIEHPLYYGTALKKEDLTTVGVRIWHVDARLLTKESDYKEFTTVPEKGAEYRISNSYYEDDDPAYREFYELKLVRNNPDIDYKSLSYNVKSDYFYEGDEFDMSKFPKQFANGTKLDSGLDLGWSIKVDGIYQTGDKYSADITVTKL